MTTIADSQLIRKGTDLNSLDNVNGHRGTVVANKLHGQQLQAAGVATLRVNADELAPIELGRIWSLSSQRCI